MHCSDNKLPNSVLELIGLEVFTKPLSRNMLMCLDFIMLCFCITVLAARKQSIVIPLTARYARGLCDKLWRMCDTFVSNCSVIPLKKKIHTYVNKENARHSTTQGEEILKIQIQQKIKLRSKQVLLHMVALLHLCLQSRE